MMMSSIFRLVFAGMVLFTLARGLFFFTYFDRLFSDFTIWDIARGFMRGLRFDISVLLTFWSPTILLLIAPLPQKIRHSARTWAIWYAYTMLIAMCLLLIGDILYFQHVNRHLFDEFFLLANDYHFLWDMMSGAYALWSLAFVAAALILAYFWRRWFSGKDLEYPFHFFKALLLISLVFLAVRGRTIEGRPLNIIDAYSIEHVNEAHLVLNGVFSTWHASRNSKTSQRPVLDDGALVDTLQRLHRDVGSDAEYYPFLQTFGASDEAQMQTGETRPNLVVVLLESWAAYYVDSFGGHSFGATPHLDEIASKGIHFKNFYANGSRSIEAIQSILASFPALRGIPDLGDGFELMNVAKIGHIAARHDYETIFMQTSRRQSFRIDAVATLFGFKHYYGLEDYPRILDYGDQEVPAFGWDYEMYQHFVKEAESFQKPMFAFMFTGTTHIPYRLPPHALNPQEHADSNEVGFLNTLAYADWSLGEFMKAASQTDWYKNTYFIFTADHTTGAFRDFTYQEQFNVPLVIYHPSKDLSHVDTSQIGSHLDLFPTIMDLLNFSGKYSVCGRSLLKNTGIQQAFISGRFGNLGLITPDGFIEHNFDQVVRSNVDYKSCKTDCIGDHVLDLNSVYYSLLQKNRWMP